MEWTNFPSFIIHTRGGRKKKRIHRTKYTFAFGSLNFLHLAPIFFSIPFHSKVLLLLQWIATHICVLVETVCGILFSPNPIPKSTSIVCCATNRWKRFIATMRTYSTWYSLCTQRRHFINYVTYVSILYGGNSTGPWDDLTIYFRWGVSIVCDVCRSYYGVLRYKSQ